MNRSRNSRTTAWLLIGGLLVPGLACWAQDDEVVTPDALAQDAAQAGMQAFMAPEVFDQWAFQIVGGGNEARERFESQTRLQLDELIRSCNLAEPQQEKLKLAAAIDRKRLFDKVEVVRRHFLAIKGNPNGFQEIWRELSPLRQEIISGPHDEKSLFTKSLRTMLSSEQDAHHRKFLADRAQFRHRATIETMFVTLDDTLGLTEEQHAALVKLALDETKPPKISTAYDSLVVFVQLSKLPEEKLKASLNPRQWKVLNRRLQQYRGMEPFLAQQGIIEN